MSKTDKFLYGGFAVVAIGSLTTLLVSVFSPPKQVAEETVEPPKIEKPTRETASTASEPPQQEMDLRLYWLDEHGNKTYITDEELAASDAIEAEFKRQEEEQRALEKAEKEWWESRQGWVERFPFEATHHPEITFDPTVYQPGKAAEWPEEEKNDAYWEMKQRVENHGYLRRFYDLYLPYTEEFEQMYEIVKEELGEKADNPIVLGTTFETLKEYHQATQQDQNAVYRENVHVEIPTPTPTRTIKEIPLADGFYNLSEEGQQVYLSAFREAHKEELKPINPAPKYEVRDVTWAEETEMLKKCIVGVLVNPKIGWDGIPKDQAIAIRDRLINKIPAAGFLEMGKDGFAYSDKYERELKAGDRLLIK